MTKQIYPTTTYRDLNNSVNLPNSVMTKIEVEDIDIEFVETGLDEQ